jgi:hypothetical protein
MLNINIVLPTAIGTLIGIIFSYIFSRYHIKIKTDYHANIFGINSNDLISGLLLFVVFGGVAGLAGIGAIIKDYDYIIKKPNIFIIETLLISILPSIGFAYIIFYRTKHITSSNIFELLILSLKFAALHVLLQISGYYRYVFNE